MYVSCVFICVNCIVLLVLCCAVLFCAIGVVTRLAGGGSAGGVSAGSVDGTGSAARFNQPYGVAVSTSGTIYVTDASNHLIRMISPTGIALLGDC